VADGGVGGFESLVVVGVAANAELLAHRIGEGEVQQVGDGGEGDGTAVAGGGQEHAEQQGRRREAAGRLGLGAGYQGAVGAQAGEAVN
jgi:hypothetical protein